MDIDSALYFEPKDGLRLGGRMICYWCPPGTIPPCSTAPLSKEELVQYHRAPEEVEQERLEEERAKKDALDEETTRALAELHRIGAEMVSRKRSRSPTPMEEHAKRVSRHPGYPDLEIYTRRDGIKVRCVCKNVPMWHIIFFNCRHCVKKIVATDESTFCAVHRPFDGCPPEDFLPPKYDREKDATGFYFNVCYYTANHDIRFHRKGSPQSPAF
jgi:hypothetical protein